MFEPESQKKICPGCKEEKPVSAFGRNKRRADGLSYYCRPCFNAVAKKSYRKRQAEKGKAVQESRQVPEGCKYCPRCGEVKDRGKFGRNKAAKDGLTNYCRPCHSRVMADLRAKNHGSGRNYLLKLRYGVTEAEVEEWKARYGGVCPICRESPAIHVDHDHMTGLFRGVLCFKCNGGLGQFEDSLFRLEEAARYLEGTGSHAFRVALDLGEDAVNAIAGQSVRFDRRTERGEAGTARKYHLWRKYGLKETDVQAMRALQVGLCAICADAPAEHIDHDHKTTAVRGLLCVGCNSGMGQLRDDPVVLRRAAEYLLGTLTSAST